MIDLVHIWFPYFESLAPFSDLSISKCPLYLAASITWVGICFVSESLGVNGSGSNNGTNINNNNTDNNTNYIMPTL